MPGSRTLAIAAMSGLLCLPSAARAQDRAPQAQSAAVPAEGKADAPKPDFALSLASGGDFEYRQKNPDCPIQQGSVINAPFSASGHDYKAGDVVLGFERGISVVVHADGATETLNPFKVPNDGVRAMTEKLPFADIGAELRKRAASDIEPQFKLAAKEAGGKICIFNQTNASNDVLHGTVINTPVEFLGQILPSGVVKFDFKDFSALTLPDGKILVINPSGTDEFKLDINKVLPLPGVADKLRGNPACSAAGLKLNII